MTPHNRRVLKTICAALFVLLLAGVTYQGVATALQRRTYRYPGRLVPAGDHQLHLTCVGTGAPTVVLEAPALGFSASWARVQEGLAPLTRVCAYDRAGLGWSEASEGPRDMRTVPDDLHTLLAGAGEVAPYVVVGDGLGAAFATEFAARFPGDTAVLVLVDTVEPGAGTRRAQAPSAWLARTGLLRLSQALSAGGSGLPGPRGGAVRAFSTRPDHLTRAAQELRQRDAVRDRARTATLPADLAVVRIESPDEGALLATDEGTAAIVRGVADAVGQWRRGRS